jgi:hypothetical protein
MFTYLAAPLDGGTMRLTRISQALAVAVLAAVMITLSPALANAGSGHRIDVGYTILQNGYWKGSGSYQNYDGRYAHVCVTLWFNGMFGGKALSSSCRNTPRGSGYAFSAPSVRCQNVVGEVFTEVTAFNSGWGQLDAKYSNYIPSTC